MSSVTAPAPPRGEIVVYEAPNGAACARDVRFDRDSVWLTQRQMADLFSTSTDNISSMHLNNIFRTQELKREATTEDSSVVRTEGSRQVRRTLTHYNLDAIISVGYRVNSRTRRALSPMGHPHPPRPPGPRLHPQPAAPRRTRTPGSPRNPGICWPPRCATRRSWIPPGEKYWTSSPATPTPGACCWNTTKTNSPRRPASSRPAACCTTTVPQRQLPISSAN